MALSLEQVLALPIRSLQQSSKAIVFVLVDGKRFWLLGGKCRRPLPQGVAGFTPREMIEILKWDLPESALREILKIKETMGGGTVVEIIEPTGSDAAPTPPSGSPSSPPTGRKEDAGQA